MRSKQTVLILGLIFFLSTFFLNCNRERKKENQFVEAMDSRTKIRYRQYMVIGKRLYKQHCANCHGENGEGLEQLYPPLAKSDYLMEDVERAICQIRYGIEGEITVNGISYNQKMAGHDDLRPLNIAEIITFITNSWGNEKGLVSAKDVEQVLSRCMQN